LVSPFRAERAAGEPAAGITIAATATAVPDFEISREQVKTYLGQVFSLEALRLEAMMSIIDNSQVRKRYCIHPVEHIIQPRPLSQLSREYAEHSLRLGRAVASEVLARAGLQPEEIDLIVTVSCTGVMIPSLDAHLINQMGFRSDVRRLPITELGCAGGAAALTRAWEHIRAFPRNNVLVVVVELPSLTFQRGNLTQANLISTILFGDGAAAAVVTGRPARRNGARGPQIVNSDSYLFPDSIDAMGFDLKESGFHILLSRDVPQLIKKKIKSLVTKFLEKNALRREQVSAFILHPGGQRLLLNMEEELGLSRCDTQFSWEMLAEYGNLSSASVLFVLHEVLQKRMMRAGEYGLLAAFGPGFSAELLLLQWT
jgi:alkylresorcinol/alkylpyrone synthase